VVAVARIVWERPGDAARAGRGMQVELVERAQSGDHEAFSELARASFGRLFGVAKLILRDQDRAEDAVQEALVLAWKHVRAIRDPEAWDAWLYRLTVRACYRLARSSKRRDVLELHVEPDREPTGHDFTGPLVERDRLGRELGRLPVDQRAVMVLHFYLDLPLTEAASILGIPVGTAKSRLHRGLETMRAAMSDESVRPVAHARERPS
jgi:RNA polymerase sigma factor (sigma-70 family)